MPTLRPERRDADLLERALAGGTVDPRVADLLATATSLSALDIAARPDPAFVRRLGERLAQEAAAIAEATPALAAPTQSRRDSRTARDRRPQAPGSRPIVVFVGRGLPRAVAGAVASVLLIGAIIGFSSNSALPGSVLYPVKQLIDQAQVGLARSSFDKGSTLLRQAQDNVVEVSRLVESPSPSAAEVNTALSSAVDRTTRGQELLQEAYTTDHEQRAPAALATFADQLAPQLDALEGRVPSSSEGLLDQLRSLIGIISRTGLTGAPLPSTTSPGGALSSAGASGVATSPSAGGTASGARTTSGSGGSVGVSGVPQLPGVSTGTGGLVVRPPSVGVSSGPVTGGVQPPSASIGSGGVSVGGGGASVSAPGGGVGVGVPSVTAGTTGVGVGGGGATVKGPSVTVTVPVPSVSLTIPKVTCTILCG